MKKHAVFFTIVFAFFVALTSVSVVFWEFYKLNKQQYIDHIFTKYSIITQIYKAHQQAVSSQVMLEANLAIYKLKIEKDLKRTKQILKKGKILKQKSFISVDSAFMLDKQGIYTQKLISDLKVTMIEFQGDIYFFMRTPSASILIQDEELKPYLYTNVLYAYLAVVGSILLTFLMILQKLKPLIKLRRKIALFGSGDMDVSFKMKGEDEIASIANEMERAREKIHNILESRTLFLRNLMHELKTPIAKGTIATQMLESQKQRDRFRSIFGRLESLVSEFALIEEVTSLGDQKNFKEYRLIDIIDGAIDMAMVEKSQVSVDVDSDIKLFASYKLYTTAIKNMIDNGIKYSTDSHVNIVFKNNELCFESKGECLSHPLEYYIEPFTKENPSKNSFGLGLYLVDSILKVHNQVLAHEYEDGINRFIFT